MSDGGFDPYKKWLAIPPEEQPPNHYRLLSVPLFEDDPDSIENAADRQMSHIRTFASGQHSDLSQKILNELSAARIVLLNPKKKTAYDAELKKKLAPKRPAAAPLPTALPLPTARPVARPVAARPAASQGEQFDFQPSEASSVTSRLPQKKPLWQQPVVIGGVAAGLMVVVGLLYAASRGGGSGDVTQSDGGRVEPTPPVVEKETAGEATVSVSDDVKNEPPVVERTPPDIKKPAVSRSVNPDSWRVRCFAGGRWTDYPREKMTTEVKGDVLTVTNTTGIHTFAIFYLPVLIEGDFNVAGDVKGQPKLLGVYSASSRDQGLLVTPPQDDVWHRFAFQRSGDKLAMKVDGKEVPIGFYRSDSSLGGYLSIAAEAGHQFSLRNVTIEVGSGHEPPPHEDEVVYLDDLQETGFQVWSRWFVLGKHGLTGEKGRPDVRYEYRGANPEHGLYVAPPPNSLGQITYALNSGYDTFEAVATIPFNLFYKNKTVASPLTFKVYGDDQQLWQSQPMQEAGNEQTCRVSVKGVRDLRLEVHCPGKADLTWGAWINPRLISSGNAELAPLARKGVDLLKLVDPAQHVLEGDAVEFDGDTLVATTDPRFVVRVPYQPSDEYDMTLIARHTGGVASDLRVGLVGGGRPFIFTISLFHSIVGLEHLDGQIARLVTNPTFKRSNLLRNGKSHTFHFQVRKQGIVVKCDGVTLVDWQEGYQRLSFPTKGPLRDTKELFFVGSLTRGEPATFRIEECRIVEHRDPAPADTGKRLPVPAGAAREEKANLGDSRRTRV